MELDVEQVDLASLARTLGRRFEGATPVGYLVGRTALRNAVVDVLGASELVAEQLVDTLVARGFIRYEGDPTAPLQEDATWRITHGA